MAARHSFAASGTVNGFETRPANVSQRLHEGLDLVLINGHVRSVSLNLGIGYDISHRL